MFDSKNKGKLKKSDFALGLHKYQIQMSQEDLDAAWSALDTRKKGYLTFEEF